MRRYPIFSLLFVLVALTLTISIQARIPLIKRRPDSLVVLEEPKSTCRTNSECFQKKLPLLSPWNRLNRRQLIDPEVILSTTECGITSQQTLDIGSYIFTLQAGQGGSGAEGAVLSARLNVTSTSFTIGYH